MVPVGSSWRGTAEISFGLILAPNLNLLSLWGSYLVPKIGKILKFHKKNKSDLTLLVHPNDHPYDSDLLEINEKNRLTKFHKKPHKKNNIGNLSLSGILIIKKKIRKN